MVISKFLNKPLLKIFVVLLFVRLVILILPILVWQLSSDSGIYLKDLFLLWNRWDAPHFLYVSQFGYTNVGDPANFIVFPPLYPLIIKIFSIFLRSNEFTAILVSMFSFSLAGTLFYKIVQTIWDKDIAFKALFLLLIFPTAYFFGAPYTESLFWLIAMCTAYFAVEKKWFISGIFVGLSFLTRFPGILLTPYLLILIIQTKEKRVKNIFLALLPIIICVLIYLYINLLIYQDPLAFRHILQDHWQKQFAWPWQSIKSSWQAARGGIHDDYALQVGFWEAIPATISFIAIPFVFRYLKNTAWSVWYAANIVLITSTSFLLSTPRYLLAIPPLFVFLAIISKKSPIFYYLWIFVSSGLLAYFSLRFVTGQWGF